MPSLRKSGAGVAQLFVACFAVRRHLSALRTNSFVRRRRRRSRFGVPCSDPSRVIWMPPAITAPINKRSNSGGAGARLSCKRSVHQDGTSSGMPPRCFTIEPEPTLNLEQPCVLAARMRPLNPAEPISAGSRIWCQQAVSQATLDTRTAARDMPGQSVTGRCHHQDRGR